MWVVLWLKSLHILRGILIFVVHCSDMKATPTGWLQEIKHLQSAPPPRGGGYGWGWRKRVGWEWTCLYYGIFSWLILNVGSGFPWFDFEFPAEGKQMYPCPHHVIHEDEWCSSGTAAVFCSGHRICTWADEPSIPYVDMGWAFGPWTQRPIGLPHYNWTPSDSS